MKDLLSYNKASRCLHKVGKGVEEADVDISEAVSVSAYFGFISSALFPPFLIPWASRTCRLQVSDRDRRHKHFIFWPIIEGE